jgi:hypothetical protein
MMALSETLSMCIVNKSAGCPSYVKSSNLDNFEHIHYYLHSSRFWPTVVNRATNNQAYQSCINTACTVPNSSACSKDGWPLRGT